MYYEGRVPKNFFNMSADGRTDYYYRVEKWHDLMEEVAKKGCRAPTQFDKVVYVIHHAEMQANTVSQVLDPREVDGLLNTLGLEQARNLPTDPMLTKALSSNPSERVQAIIVSPARKAMQTALEGLSSSLPKATWTLEPDIGGFGLEGIHGKPHPKLGSKMLREMGQTELLEQYKNLRDGWEKESTDGKKKWESFMQRLLERPEKRIIMVTHKEVAKLAGFSKMHAGEVRVAKLMPDGRFVSLSPPDCWPENL